MYRIYCVGVFLFFTGFLLIGKLVFIQFVEGDTYQKRGAQRIIEEKKIASGRGNIYASDGALLATSVTNYEIRWDAQVPHTSTFEKHKDSLAKSLAKFLQQPYTRKLKELQQARQNKEQYVFIAKNLSYADVQKIRSFPLFRLGRYKGGIIVEQGIKRVRPLGNIAERTVGHETGGTDGTFFRVGIEGAFSQLLSGEEGSRIKRKIANDQWKPISNANKKEPTQGFDVYTTIDTNVQDVVHTALLSQLEAYEAHHGTAVVMEVETGAIRAIANLGRTSKGTYSENFNYAIGEAHEPGSTFKLMAMIAALEDRVIDVKTPIKTGNGKLMFYGKHEVNDIKKGGHGTISAAKVFEVSSNVGMVKIIHGHYKKDPKHFVNRMYNMDLHKPLEIPIKGEVLPKIPHPDNKKEWDGLDLPWMAFGYGLSLTPLQILTFYNAVANEGKMVKPLFVSKISDAGKHPEKTFSTQVINPSICSESTLKKVQQMMFNVVDKKWGTAYRIKDKSLSMAGKTGTCQVDYNHPTKEVQYISSFVGYFPAEKPKYSCIVVIHRPNKAKGYYGATVAAPVFKNIAKKIQNSVPTEVALVREELDALKTTNRRSLTHDADMVPNVKGLPLRDALSILEKMGLKVQVTGKGKVMSQSVKPGSSLKHKQTIALKLS